MIKLAEPHRSFIRIQDVAKSYCNLQQRRPVCFTSFCFFANFNSRFGSQFRGRPSARSKTIQGAAQC
jgi:hypothetical protein